MVPVDRMEYAQYAERSPVIHRSSEHYTYVPGMYVSGLPVWYLVPNHKQAAVHIGCDKDHGQSLVKNIPVIPPGTLFT